MTRIKALLAAAVALCLVALGAVVAMPAAAHTPNVMADCDGLVVDLKSYVSPPPGEENSVTVTIDGVTAPKATFQNDYFKEFPAPDSTKSYDYTVVVDAWDDNDPANPPHYSKTFSGKSTPCTPPCVSDLGSHNIDAQYTTDDFHATVRYTGTKPICDGVSKTVSLNSYKTDGPTWETSGTQVFVDHDQVTIDSNQTSGDLVVDEPNCYYQTDLYWGSTRYDGVDGALPHYPDSVTPHNLIDWANGGSACPPPVNPSGSYTVVCDDDGAVVTIGQLSNEQGVTWRLEVDGASQPVATGDVVQVPGEADLALVASYQGQDSVEQEGKAPKACPPVVQPSGSFTTECTATGAQADIGALTEGTVTGGSYRLVSGNFSQTVTTGQQNVAVPASSAIKLEYVPAQGPAKELDSEQSPAACPPPPPPTGDVTKSSVPATGTVVAPGQTIDYTVTVKNTGQVAIADAPVVDTLPTHVTAVPGTVSDSGQVSPDGRTITWTVSLAVGATKSFTYQGLVAANAPAAATLVNKATFLLKESTTTHTVGSRGLNVVKAVAPTGTVEFGETLTYTLAVTTTGNLPQTNVVVTDPIPTGTTYTAGSAGCDPAGPCTPSVANGVVSWSLGSMAAGSTRTVSFQVTVDTPAEDEEGAIPAVTIVNSGAAASAEVPSTPSNEVETPVTAVKPVKVGPNQPDAETPEADVPAAPTDTGVLPQTGSGIPSAWLAGMAGLLLLMGLALLSIARPAGRMR